MQGNRSLQGGLKSQDEREVRDETGPGMILVGSSRSLESPHSRGIELNGDQAGGRGSAEACTVTGGRGEEVTDV